MKKLAIISVAILIVGIILPLIGATLGPRWLIDIGNILIAIGGFMTFVFLTAWMAQVSRVAFFISLVIWGMVFLSFVVYGQIKCTEFERQARVAYESNLESMEKEQKMYVQLEKAQFTIDSLSKELKKYVEQ